MGVICSCPKAPEKLNRNFTQQHASTFTNFISIEPQFQVEAAQQELSSYLQKHRAEMTPQVINLFFAAAANPQKGLSSLVLERVRPEDWVHLSSLFAYGDCVESFVLTATRLDVAGFNTLCGYLEVLGGLIELRLVDMGLGHYDFHKLATACKKLKRVEKLDLSKNELNPGHIRSLAPTIPKLSSLRELNLDDNCIEDEGCDLLRPRLYPLRGLRLVSLRFNSITPAGYMQFQDLLQTKENLRIVVDGLKIDK
jgi:hypothetical protein